MNLPPDFIRPLGEVPKPIFGHQISQSFLDTIGCPDNASEIVFSISAAGKLMCSALVWENDPLQQVRREWEVQLKTTDAFYKVLTGVLK